MAFFATRRFCPLFITQFLGAFNDNLLKNALVILITYKIAEQIHENTQLLITIASGLFILPFFLFSATAGQLADKYDRAKLTRIIKIAEIFIMLFATIGFFLHNHWLLITVLFASGMHSTFFGPIKYALLPQHLRPSELVEGNAYIEAATFIAILLGTICGGLSIMHSTGEHEVSTMLLVISLLGYLTSKFIPYSPAPQPNLILNHNIWQATKKIMSYSYENKRVFFSILAISWFWFLGITFLSQFPNFVKHQLHAESKIVTSFLTAFSVGIALGSIIGSKILKGKISSKYVPLAAIGMAIFIVDLYFTSQSKVFFNLSGLLAYQVFYNITESTHILIDLLLIAICAGIYIVPLYVIVQIESEQVHLARIIAANNVFNALFMVLSTIFCLFMLTINRPTIDIFLSLAIVNIIVAYLIYKLL